ncbi:MAG: GNAT family N-acetyltransferase [Planctomycetota bacterium]|jgi:RimJ/RimL family protein N-acetyltransferase
MAERPTLEKERLLLRPFSVADGREVQRLAGDRAIAETTQNIPHPYEDGMAEIWIATHEDTFVSGRGVHFAIFLKSESRLIGAVSLLDMVKGHQAELGYWIGKPFWGRGYCTEASRAVIDYGFHVLGLQRIHACHMGRNPASGRVMRKLGMRYEGKRPHHVFKWGVLEDLELYGLLRGDQGKASDES